MITHSRDGDEFVGVNSFIGPGKMAVILRVIFKLILPKSSLGILCEIVLRWMSQNAPDEKSTLIR